MFLIDDLTTIEYLKRTLPVYLVQAQVDERYKFVDYQTRQNKNSAFRAKALQYYDRRSSDRDSGPYSMTIMVKSSLYLHAMKI